MFDEVYVKCPDCGKENAVQTKVGPCLMGEYTTNSAPPEILLDIAKKTIDCECGAKYKLLFEFRTKVIHVGNEDARWKRV